MMLNAATRRCCLHHARAVQRRVVVNPMESHGCSFGKQRSISSSSQQYLSKYNVSQNRGGSRNQDANDSFGDRIPGAGVRSKILETRPSGCCHSGYEHRPPFPQKALFSDCPFLLIGDNSNQQHFFWHASVVTVSIPHKPNNQYHRQNQRLLRLLFG